MGYSVNYDSTLLAETSSMNLSMDFIASIASDVRVYKNGSLLTINADYSFSNVVQYPYYTTFTLNFVQPCPIGTVLRIEKNEDWNQWIQFKFPNIEDRIAALEAITVGATNVSSRILTLETSLGLTMARTLVNETNISTLTNDLSLLVSRVSNIENDILYNITPKINNAISFLGVQGSVTIENNQSVPSVISALEIDGYVHSSVKVDYEISRKTGTNYLSSVGTLYLVCKNNGVWYTERGLQVIDLDGVTFEIATDVNRVGTFSYTSDYLAGAGYEGTFKFRTTKFEV